jgi:hypothetical protein
MSVAVPQPTLLPAIARQAARWCQGWYQRQLQACGYQKRCGKLRFPNTYDQDEETAVFMKRLIDFGAVIVGKTKMTAFASREKPIDWFDFQCPLNPRGDAYLEPGASSTDSAAATAAYQWVDICICTDSMRSNTSQGILAYSDQPV